MKKSEKKKIRNYFFYLAIFGVLWGIIYVLISQLIPDDGIFYDFISSFVFIMIGGIVSLVLFYYFRGFYNKGML